MDDITGARSGHCVLDKFIDDGHRQCACRDRYAEPDPRRPDHQQQYAQPYDELVAAHIRQRFHQRRQPPGSYAVKCVPYGIIEARSSAGQHHAEHHGESRCCHCHACCHQRTAYLFLCFIFRHDITSSASLFHCIIQQICAIITTFSDHYSV